MAKIFLGEALVKEGLISSEQLRQALEEQKTTGELLGDILIRLNFVNDETLARVLSCQLGLDYVDLGSLNIPLEVIQLIPEEIARKYSVVPIELSKGKIVLVMTNPQDAFAIDEIRKAAAKDIEIRITTFANINRALDKYYGAKAQLKKIITGSKGQKKERPKEEELKEDYSKFSAEEAPAVQFVDQLITDAVKDGASDVHIEPEEESVSVRFRVDGVLRDVVTLPKDMQDSVASRIKIISNLDIAEKRMPQDGRFQRTVKANEIDVRVSICPVIYGEKIVMRILNRTAVSLDLEQVGFDQEDLLRFEALIKKPYGILLVTGPTGSGKTTTLYSSLERIKSREKNLVTIEDPVEYELKGINQSQINVKAGVTFSTLLRSLMRQDPDIMLVGEIRDLETADIAIKSALTGHLVLSTLHTNDAPSSVTRLVDMGIEPFLVSSSTVGIMAQRLLRTICPKCKEKEIIAPELLKDLGLPKESVLYRGKGCENCRQTGYKGRTGIFEIMIVDEEMKELIGKRATLAELKSAARKNGMRTLREDGLHKALKGITTVEEVVRLTDKD